MGTRKLVSLVALLVCTVSLMTPSLAGAAPKPKAGAAVRSASQESASLGILQQTYASLNTKSSDSDPYYWTGTQYTTGQDVCFRCQAGPALVAAALWRANGSTSAASRAITSLSGLLAAHQQTDGSFGPPMNNEGSNDIQTALFANQLGQAYYLLEPVLSQQTKDVWSAAIVGAARWLIKNGNLKWYTNGNIAIANALTMVLAYKLAPTDNQYFVDAYKTALAFAVSPPQGRWPGFGFIWVKKPSSAGANDGIGYLAESGGGAPGLDLDYVQMQSSVFAWMYYLIGTDTIGTYLNAELNELLLHVDTTKWWLQTGGGTRHPQANRWVGFDTSALVVSAVVGGRQDLWGYLSSYEKFISAEFASAGTYANPGMAYNFGTVAAPIMLLLSQPASTPAMRQQAVAKRK